MRNRYDPGPAHGPTNRPVLRIGLSVVRRLGSARATPVTAKAPGTRTRKMEPEPVRGGPRTANGSRLRPSMTAWSAGAMPGSSSILRRLGECDDPGGDARQSAHRNPKPGRTARCLVADFVRRFFQQEKAEQRRLVRLRYPLPRAFGVARTVSRGRCCPSVVRQAVQDL